MNVRSASKDASFGRECETFETLDSRRPRHLHLVAIDMYMENSITLAN
jgi:hypothetical protein